MNKFSAIGKFSLSSKQWSDLLPDDQQPIDFIVRYENDKIQKIIPNVNDKIRVVLNVAVSLYVKDGRFDDVINGMRVKINELIKF